MRGALLHAPTALGFLRRALRVKANLHTTSVRAMPSLTPWAPNRYPPSRRSDHVDVYKSEAKGEVRVPDPYQWLEQNSKETEQWVDAQEAFTRAYLDQNPERQALEDEIRQNEKFEKVCTLRMEAGLCTLNGWCSSPPRVSNMTTGGTGPIIRGCRPSTVCLAPSIIEDPAYSICVVIYRSKDKTLPDFNKDIGPGGEVFFDVSNW